MRRWRWSANVILWISGVALLAACGSGDSVDGDTYYVPTDEPLDQHQVPSFEEFQASTLVAGMSEELYLVEWDYPIRGAEELRSYYDARFNSRLPKSAVKLTPETGADTGQCDNLPVPSNCVDDKFYNNEQQYLRYCVSDAFGASKTAVVNALAEAGDEWRSVANVQFVYVPSDDNVCSQADAVPNSVDFKVAPWSSGGACSYWPKSGRACVAKTLVYNTSSSFAPNTMTGVMGHELGHILGFNHEHERPDANIPACVHYEMRYLTPWDEFSIMGYPNEWGGCSIGGGNTVTARDGEGARALYGMPPAWYVPTALDIAFAG